MYSGTLLTMMSGRVLGAHQKIDRLARSCLNTLAPETAAFPSSRAILQFEGLNGPDGIKRKSPARDEPWHYFSPFDEADTQLMELIQAHFDKLVAALKIRDDVRAAFEAAWLAHSIVDGLTPAHHFPYEEKLIELRGGQGIETRTSLKEKLVMTGDNRRETVLNNWKMWGPRGLIVTHGFFEFGVAALLAPVSHKRLQPAAEDIATVRSIGPVELFRQKAREVAGLNMFEQYYKAGWTPGLARQVKQVLIPIIVQTVALVWYAAVVAAAVPQESEA